jgi:two-component system, NtrC family, nitrogen regulation sensor histidine kinase NtrY
VMQDVAVEVLFNRVYTLLRPAIDKKHIKFTIRLLQEDLQLKADPELLEQVLINLLLNAIDALEHTADPAIELTAGRTGSGQTALQVKDNGTGIDEQTIQHIFVPFFTTKKKGSGIGLSLSKQLMLLHKGNITVQSVKGEGTVFKLTFPS